MNKLKIVWIALCVLCAACGDDATPNKQADRSGFDLDAPDQGAQDMAADAALPDQGADLPDELDSQPDAADMVIDQDIDMSMDMPPAFKPPTVRVIEEGNLALFERSFAYKLLELKCEGKDTTYAQWISPEATTPRPFPVVAMTQPYAGIAWSGDPTDAKWAARGPGLHLDDSEPGFVPGSGAVIAYEPMTPMQGAEQGIIHLLNGFGVLHMFGRFYAGGSIQNDVDDMTCGLSYLAVADGADLDKIGIYGGSWGGFNAVYGALRAPAEVTPKLGVALTPLTDFIEEWQHADAAAQDPRPAVAQQFAAFFEPYKRRIAQSTGGAPEMGGFAAWTNDALASSANQTKFLTIHDEEDALVPFTMNQDFAQVFGQDRVEAVWLRTDKPLDLAASGLSHGPRLGGLYVTLLTFTGGYLHTRLADPSRPQLFIFYDRANLKLTLEYIAAQRARGQGTQQLAQRMIELADRRVVMFDVSNNQVKAGAEEVAALVNEVFGTGYTAFTVAPGLMRNGL